MKRAYVVAAVVLASLAGVPVAVSAQTAFAVRISVTTTGGAQRLGSGFVVELRDRRATIVTASHVTQDAKIISVAFAVDITEPFEVAPADRLADEFDNPDGLSVFIVRGPIPAGVVALRSDPNGVLTPGEPLTVVGFPQSARTVITNRPTYAGTSGRLRVLGAAMGEGGSGSAVVRNDRLVGIVTTEEGARTNFVTARSVEDMVSGFGIALTGASAPPARESAVTTPSPASPRTGPFVAPTDPSAAPRFRADAWQLPDDPMLGFIEVPAGQFTMGSDRRQDSDAVDDEMPQHKVTLPAFFIGKYEVTVAQYKACVADGGCPPGDPRAVEGDGDLPVRFVSWHEARAYCTWLEAKLKAWAGTPRPLADALAGRRDGVAWRIALPSEAEWERAARGTDTRIYPWGTGIDRSRARYGMGSEVGPAPVGTLPAGASFVGAMDMAGNVWEWTRSIYAKYPYAPDDGRERLDAPDFDQRVLRGGSFGDTEDDLRAAYRRGNNPVDRGVFIGFRLVSSRLRP